VAKAAPVVTLLLGYIGPLAVSPNLQKLPYVNQGFVSESRVGLSHPRHYPRAAFGEG
jgi:hypothetical protein